MLSITKIFKFDAAHYLPFHKGLCKNLHGHGYRLEVEVTGEVKAAGGPTAGMIMDFGYLKEKVAPILEKLDHHSLNDIFANPTAEIMAEWIASRLKESLPPWVDLVRIRLWETENCYAEWRKD